MAKIRDVMFSVFRECRLSPINSNAKESEIKTWKSHATVKDCYRKLFKKIDPVKPETYMSKILNNLWKGGKKNGPRVQIAFAISVCETVLDPNNTFVSINEDIIKPILKKNLVSFLNLYCKYSNISS